MYEKMTYESILQKMLNMVSDDVDKREGSIIYDALAPAAYFLADQFFQLDNFEIYCFRIRHWVNI